MLGPDLEDLLSKLFNVGVKVTEFLHGSCLKFRESSSKSLRDIAANFNGDIPTALKFLVNNSCYEPLLKFRSAIAANVDFSVKLR